MIRGLLFFRYVSVSRYIKKIADIISFTVTRHKKELFLNDGNSSFSYATFSSEVTPRISSAERIGYLWNTIDPMYPTIVVTIPHNIAAIVTFTTSLNPNKTRSPGIGDAVPGECKRFRLKLPKPRHDPLRRVPCVRIAARIPVADNRLVVAPRRTVREVPREREAERNASSRGNRLLEAQPAVRRSVAGLTRAQLSVAGKVVPEVERRVIPRVRLERLAERERSVCVGRGKRKRPPRGRVRRHAVGKAHHAANPRALARNSAIAILPRRVGAMTPIVNPDRHAVVADEVPDKRRDGHLQRFSGKVLHLVFERSYGQRTRLAVAGNERRETPDAHLYGQVLVLEMHRAERKRAVERCVPESRQSSQRNVAAFRLVQFRRMKRTGKHRRRLMSCALDANREKCAQVRRAPGFAHRLVRTVHDLPVHELPAPGKRHRPASDAAHRQRDAQDVVAVEPPRDGPVPSAGLR